MLALFSVMGFSFSGAASNQGLMFARLKPFEDRPGAEHSVQTVLGRLGGPLFGLPGAIVVGFTPPSIPGLSRFGGFEFQVLDQSGQDITQPGGTRRRRSSGPATSRRKLRPGLFSPFTANDPQLQVTIDRERALALGLPLNEITSAMQIFLGSQYVNDFEFNNRAYRVYVQADQQFRSNPQALRQLYARTRGGEMVPLEQVVSIEEVDRAAGDQPLQPVPIGDDQRIGGAGRQLGRGAQRDGTAGRRRTCPTAWATRGRASRSRKRRPAVSRT